MVERNLAPKDGQTANLGKADAKADKSTKHTLTLLAEVAQLVEHNLAKVGVADSSSVFRSQDPDLRLEWWNGRHEGLKIPWPTTAVRVQVPLRVHVSPICNRGTFYGLRIFSYGSGEAISPLKFPIELRFGGIFWLKYNGANQKVQKRDVFFAPRFLYPFHTSKGGIFAPFDRLLYFLEGRRVDQIEHDDLIAACLHCGTAAAEGGNRIAQRLTLEGIV